MLTFGFEIEATRLVKKQRERRLRRRLRAETGDSTIASCSSGSESDDARLLHKAERRRTRSQRARSGRRSRRCWPCPSSQDADAERLSQDAERLQWDDELSSSEEEYEQLILSESLPEAYERLKTQLAEAHLKLANNNIKN